MKSSHLFYAVVRVEIELLGARVKCLTRPHKNADFLCGNNRAEKVLNLLSV